MSADLLAEFDSFYTPPKDSASNITTGINDLSLLGTSKPTPTPAPPPLSTQPWQTSSQAPSQDIWGDMSSFQAPAAPANKSQDDIWGTFEDATNEGRTTHVAVSQIKGDDHARNHVPNHKPTRSAILRRPTIDIFSGNLGDLDAPGGRYPSQSKYDPSPVPTPEATSTWDGDVLFDAADELETAGDDDDFGDFETGTTQEPAFQPSTISHPLQIQSTATATVPKQTAINPSFVKPSIVPKQNKPKDLLSAVLNTSGPLPYPQAPKSPSFQERNPFAELGLQTKQSANTKKDESEEKSPVTAWPTYEPKKTKLAPFVDSPANDAPLDEDWADFGDFGDVPTPSISTKPSGMTSKRHTDDWGDFEDMPEDLPPMQPTKASAKESTKATIPEPADSWTWDSFDQTSSQSEAVPSSMTASGAPPTNIPPPSVLLTVFPALFNLSTSHLFKPVDGHPSLKTRILNDPTTHSFLQSYMLIANVCARIIAGRKVRWNRDAHLSQAMKIGPAMSGSKVKGGMKLTGIDRAEQAREEREMADVVRAWRAGVGRLRSAVATANSLNPASQKPLYIPEISEIMTARTVSGALTAPKPCVVCGLRRDERVAKVDDGAPGAPGAAEDLFGEWWVEFWGHRECVRWWEENEQALRGR